MCIRDSSPPARPDGIKAATAYYHNVAWQRTQRPPPVLVECLSPSLEHFVQRMHRSYQDPRAGGMVEFIPRSFAAPVTREHDGGAVEQTMNRPAPVEFSEQTVEITVFEATSRRMLWKLHDLFDVADTDGDGKVSTRELARLLGRVFVGLFNQAPGKVDRLVEELCAVQFQSGRVDLVDFTEFIKLLCSSPWCELLPAEVRAGFPMLVSSLMKTELTLKD
eukprot:TRINITY_DN3840_c0_g1_i4.p1 TRINITY_DN3840_c0_g1~~TRINITY_DN3840_c0_g1_i4.p1  ORF type:complete len:220 (+),score=38.90 TRINITY_DN3840_c0_g1_i4:192-851(+)